MTRPRKPKTPRRGPVIPFPGRLIGKFDVASIERTMLATKRVKEALDSVEGLTPSERSQVLSSLAVFGVLASMVASSEGQGGRL